MSNDKDFDRLFQKAFNDWSFEPSEEGVRKMATQLNAMENTRLDGLFSSKLSAWKQAASTAALKRMKWLLFWRKNRAVLTGSAMLLILASGGWWYVGEQKASTRETRETRETYDENSNRVVPETLPIKPNTFSNPEGSNLNPDLSEINQPEPATSGNAKMDGQKGISLEVESTPALITPAAPSRSAEIAAPSLSLGQESLSASMQTKLQNDGAESRTMAESSTPMSSDGKIESADDSDAVDSEKPAIANAPVEVTNPVSPGQETTASLEEELDSDAATKSAPLAENLDDEEVEPVSVIPAAPWRSFKPLNWYYAVSVGVDLGMSQSCLTPAPHFGFRVTRLLNPLISVYSGLNYLQRAQISESLHYTDTVYSFGMELHEREVQPLRIHFLEVPLLFAWQFAPGQYLHVGGSASYAFTQEVIEITRRWAAENASLSGPERMDEQQMYGLLPGLAQWDVNLKVGYGIKFNPQWGAQLSGTIGMRDITDGAVFKASTDHMNRNVWIQGSIQYQLNRIK